MPETGDYRDKPIRLSVITKMHPMGVSMVTVRRWASRGLLRPDGERVRLYSWKIGGERFTTISAYEDFVRELNE
jgi:DNA-binding transcriptional MerR regulator